jgi:DNA-binding XRE family transcriptional regulator
MKIYKNLDINDLENEIWKIIEDFSDYSVSNLGRVKRIIPDKHNHKLKILKQNKNSGGYFKVDLWKNGKYKTKYIHRLVFETHIGKLEEGYDAHHINENRENNFVENLEKVPKKEHISFHTKGDRNPNFGIKRLGKNNPNFKITNQKIIDIKNDIEKGNLTQVEMAKKHKVSTGTISNIKNGKYCKND